MTKPVIWAGTVDKCDLCHTPLHQGFVDGATEHGPWAIMCSICHAFHGIGLGTGLGQYYVPQGDDWVKVAG